MPDNTGFTIPPKLYNFLKYIALVVLPALAALIIGIGVLLHWEAGTAVAGVVTLVDTFLGAILGKSSSNFQQQDRQVVGDLVFGTDQDGNAYAKKLSITKENPIFEDQSQVVLNVSHERDIP